MTPEPGHRTSAYTDSGVDIPAASRAKEMIGQLVSRTFTPDVVRQFGHFGGFFRAPGTDNRAVLVSSADSVGTKVLVAMLAGRHRGIGVDLVNHCVNDILACGARPLFFLDYFASAEIDEVILYQLVDGMSDACQQAGCALIGGETAQLPDIYLPGCYDLAGFIVGIVEVDSIVDGSTIREGDLIIGLPSDGLHTNGFSLARSALGLTGPDVDHHAAVLDEPVPELGESLGDALLRPHRSYLHDVAPLLEKSLTRGMAHVTGGGTAGNVSRVIPNGLCAVIDSEAWAPPPLFERLQSAGSIDRAEMYTVFNMGIGFVLIVDPSVEAEALGSVPGARTIGRVERATSAARVRIHGVDGM